MSSTGSGPRPVRDDAGVYGPALTESMMPAYGSKTLLEATSAAMPGVRQTFIFGRATVVGAYLHLEFPVVFRSLEAWAAAVDRFLVAVKSRPLVERDLVSA